MLKDLPKDRQHMRREWEFHQRNIKYEKEAKGHVRNKIWDKRNEELIAPG